MNINDLLFGFVLGVVPLGCVLIWHIVHNRNNVSKSDIDGKYVPRGLYEKVEEDRKKLQEDVILKNQEVLALNKEVSSQQQNIENLKEKLESNKKEIEDLHNKLTTEFENIASRVLEKRSDSFIKTNKESISAILGPLNQRIEDFRKRVEDTYSDETKERSSLKAQIEQLMDLNRQVSDDANNLASALKGDVKAQGNWGEVRLEMILEKMGLVRGVHYASQNVFVDDEGQRKIPDYIINLPDEKHLIIDSKVSLVAYEGYFSATEERQREKLLKDHINSLKGHVKELSKKNYQSLYEINPPDYILLFVPIESAYMVAIKQDLSMFEEALEQNIVIVTSSTLLATLRTVSYIWKQENQKRNVLEIAKQSGALYDKFVDFVNDLKDVGVKIEQARDSHDSAMNKLSESKRRGNSIIGKIEKIKELGANATKVLPKDIIDRAKLEIESAGIEE